MPTLVAYREYKRSSHESYKYWEIPENYLSKLTLEQLDSLGDLNKDSTNHDYTFRQVQFKKKFEVDAFLQRKSSKSSLNVLLQVDREKS